jgi:hypothetical protein
MEKSLLEARLEKEVESLRAQLRRAEQNNFDLRNRATFLESEHKRQEDAYETLKAQFQQLLRKVRRAGCGCAGRSRGKRQTGRSDAARRGWVVEVCSASLR